MIERTRGHCSRRDVLRLAAGIAGLAAAGGLRRAPAAASRLPTAQDGVTISFWSRDSGEVLVEPVIAAWNESHPNQIETTFIPGDQFVQKFAAAVAGGEAPDLIAVDLIYMPAFSAAGQMTDITDQARALPFYEQLSPPHMNLGTYQDRLYSLPFNADGSFLLYNKNLFTEAGLDPETPPTTWAEITDAANKITALGDGKYGFYFSGSCPGCNAFTLLPYVWASGGDVLSEDGAQATLTDPAVKAMLEFVHGLWDAKQIPPAAQIDTGTDFFNTFATGTIGMVGTGAFAIAELKLNFPEVDFGVTPLPGQSGGQSSFAGGDTIAIPTGSERVDEAFEFMTWYLSDEVQVEQLAKNNGLTLRTDLVENKYSQQDPRYIVVANAMYGGRTPYSLTYNQLFNDANSPWLTMLQRAIFDGEIDEAIAAAQESFTEIIAG
jgi:multiple sugar transport system substrate-binding protein